MGGGGAGDRGQGTDMCRAELKVRAQQTSIAFSQKNHRNFFIQALYRCSERGACLSGTLDMDLYRVSALAMVGSEQLVAVTCDEM